MRRLLDFSNFPQQPVLFEDNRSKEEKHANAKLLNEQRIIVQVKRYGLGLVAGLALGLGLGHLIF